MEDIYYQPANYFLIKFRLKLFDLQMGQPCCEEQRAHAYFDYNPHSKIQRLNIPSTTSVLYQNEPAVSHFREVQKVKNINPTVLQIEQRLHQFHPSKEFIPPEGKKQYKAYAINNKGFIYDSQSQWKDGVPHGMGKLFYPNGSLYTGYFWKGVPNGEGRFVSSQGWYYQGQIINQQAGGNGVFSNQKNGYFYEGNWASDLPNGEGKQIWRKPNKRQITYEGQFLNGKKHGRGKYKSFQWEYYGPFSANEMTGSNGTIKYINGQSFDGDFVQGKKHGYGIYKWLDGSSYEGQYQNDKKSGHGKYISAGMHVFEGEWKNGQRDGVGVLTIEGKNYNGVWQNDIPISNQNIGN